MTISRYCIFTISLILFSFVSFAADHDGNGEGVEDTQVVNYPANFFDRYHPNTALDMVRQLPGFQLDDGTNNRGFASAVGNILINNRRLSVKQDIPSDTLSRIPASQVERIQLVRGQGGGIDLQGQAVVANVFLRKETDAAVRWDAYIEHNNTASLKPAGSISISNTWNSIEYNAGMDIERNTSGYYGNEQEYDGAGTLLSDGPESSTEDGYQLNGIFLNTSTMFGDTATHLNAKFFSADSHYERPSLATELASGTVFDEFIVEDRITTQYELGLDAERNLFDDLTGKLIFLLTDRSVESTSSRNNSNSVSGQTLFRLADTNTDTKERIVRLEFDWEPIANHSVQVNLEGAFNVIDRNLLQTDDRGVGPVTVTVPGANSRVEENRGDFLLIDTWSLGQYELDYGMGLEVSSVKQTGDADQSRNFTYLKPVATLTHSPSEDQQTRFHINREVSQLNLNDFVSATVFEDDDLALGNPDIKPETTWGIELSHERRFGEISVVSLTAFHHWISDVLDLLPLSDDFEAPGNIGNGKRWGVEFEGTMPLEWTGLSGSKLELTLRWQDSSVTDPVTGNNRILSGESGQNAYRSLTNRNKNNQYFIGLNFRQDMESARIAWGWSVAERAERPLYKVNEFEALNEDIAVDAFIETTRWFGLKVRFDAQNLSDDASVRERIKYTGRRSLTPVDTRLVNGRHNGRRLVLSVSGTF